VQFLNSDILDKILLLRYQYQFEREADALFMSHTG